MSKNKNIHPLNKGERVNFSLQEEVDSAIQNYDSGNLSVAEGICRNILDVTPDHPIINHLLGIIAQQTGNFSAAESLISKAIEIQPDYVDAHISLGNSHQMRGRYEEALACYQRAITLSPDNLDTLINLGNILLELKRFDDALNHYEKALALNPDHAQANCGLGAAFFKLGSFEKAEAAYNKALAATPEFPQASYNFGNLLMEVGRYAEAAENYGKALIHLPKSPDVLFGLGNAILKQGRHGKAVEYYEKAIAVRPNHSRSHNNLGAAVQELGFRERAAECFKKATECDPENSEVWFNLHAMYYWKEDLEIATNCLDKALSASSDNTDARFFLGMLRDRQGKTEEANYHFRHLSQTDMTNFDAGRQDSWQYIKSATGRSLRLFGTTPEGLRLGLDAAEIKGMILEFGVRFGTSIRYISENVDQEVHGFDSFQGLPEAWYDAPAGTYTTQGELPEIPENVHLHVGWFEESLPPFIAKHRDLIRYINVDCDLYSSTKTILDLLASQIVPGTVIVFDEYFGNLSWREDEFRAFQEFVDEFDREYEYLGASILSKQAVVIMR